MPVAPAPNAVTAKTCCTPSSGRDVSKSDDAPLPETSSKVPAITTCKIPGGPALQGTDRPVIDADEESPCRSKTVKPFLMMQTTVTNELFAAFINDTGYETDADRYGWSYVFAPDRAGSSEDANSLTASNWWRREDGANWRLINGPGSESDWHADHPVVHVTWNDASAFASWAGGRLPTELEWEHAARGGQSDVVFPWGNREPNDTDFQPCNIWQGRFPNLNIARDGFVATAPAKSFAANGYGLHNMCGNVWEWIAQPMKLRGRGKDGKAFAKMMRGTRLLKGGSFLCHKSYCFRYRIAARTGNTPDTSTAHQGFRVAFDPDL